VDEDEGARLLQQPWHAPNGHEQRLQHDYELVRACAGSEGLCSLFRCGLELGEVSLSLWETTNDLVAHLVFCPGQRYVSKMNQRPNGIDRHIDGINGWT
jgi:hypothetical protein